MDPHMLFQIANPLAAAGWLLLATAPLAPRLADIVSGIVIPVLLSLLYAGAILAFWTSADGGFDSLGNVMLLFASPGVALAGWAHYLAFDLFIGAWEVRTARREGLPHLLVLPCLVLTFLFGPIGLLLFLALRLVRSSVLKSPLEV
jgi:hypothetical protein